MSEKLVTVATFGFPVEAHLFRTRLEEEGITCFIQNENVNLWGRGFVGAAGSFSIELQVRESDVDKAIQIIKETRKG